jgi:DMSO/TMAO reductase YedYZ molybdopterin-dependent catalytic subunit
LKHGYPLRALALGWTGANCVKWLKRITVMQSPFNGFFMDQVYRVFQKGQKPATGGDRHRYRAEVHYHPASGR